MPRSVQLLTLVAPVAALILSSGALAQRLMHIDQATPESVVLDLSSVVEDPMGCLSSNSFDVPDFRFDNDSAHLLPSASRQVDTLATALRSLNFSFDHFVLEGHTSSTGGWDHNMRLSIARAESVRRALAERGVPDERISIRGYGKGKPLYPTQPAHSDNRRVTVRRLPGGSAAVAAVHAADGGRTEISVQVRAYDARTATSYEINPGTHRFATRDPFHLCVSTSRPGVLVVLNSPPDSSRYTPVSAALLPAGDVRRIPSAGTFRFAAAAGSEMLRLLLFVCAPPGIALADLPGQAALRTLPPCPPRPEAISLTSAVGRDGETATLELELLHMP